MIVLFKKKDECCGCTACESICPKKAITMKSDEEGFLYPEIDTNKCVECKKCLSLCPLKQSDTQKDANNPRIYACKHKSKDVQMTSTSGGLFTAVSDIILGQGGVIYGAAHNEKVETVHIRAENVCERDRCKGSKYVQSTLNDTFDKIRKDLLDGRYVLFTGTPCHVAGLLMYLKETKTCVEKLFTADLLCHGVPSPQVFRDFVCFCSEKTGKKVFDIMSRQKNTADWPGEEKIVFEDGTHMNRTMLTLLWSKLFYSVLIQRPVCHVCRYAQPARCGDITMADFWGIEQTMPDFYDKLGVSLLFVNSAKGERLIEAVKNTMEVKGSCLSDCLPYQENLNRPSRANPRRSEFWKIYNTQGFEAAVTAFGLYGAKAQIKDWLKNILKYIGVLEIAQKVIAIFRGRK